MVNYYDIRPWVLKPPPGECPQKYHPSIAETAGPHDHFFPERGLALVSIRSPRVYKNAVERIAYYFKREFHYDFPQYLASEHSVVKRHRRPDSDDSNLLAFLWYDADETNYAEAEWPTFGACCFRLRGDRWVFDWVWFHLYERRKGHLTRAWPLFRAMFGDFGIAPPVSPALQRFLERQAAAV